jgi:hypothetical protein
MNAGSARFGSVIHGPESFNALKKLGAIRGSFFFARVHKGQKPQSGMPYANASLFCSTSYGVEAVPQTRSLPICVNFCRLILISVNWQKLSWYACTYDRNDGNGCITKVCIINREQHVERKKRRAANSYRWWCFGYCHR